MTPFLARLLCVMAGLLLGLGLLASSSRSALADEDPPPIGGGIGPTPCDLSCFGSWPKCGDGTCLDKKDCDPKGCKSKMFGTLKQCECVQPGP